MDSVQCGICDAWHLSNVRRTHVDHCAVCGTYRLNLKGRDSYWNAQGIEVVRGIPRPYHQVIKCEVDNGQA